MHDQNPRGAFRPPALRRLFAALLLPLFLAGAPGPEAYPRQVDALTDTTPTDVDPTFSGADPSPPGPEAQAVITTWDGAPLPKTWPLGVPIGLSAAKSVAGTHPTRSIRWDIEPAWVDQHSRRYAGNRQIVLATGVRPKTVTVTLSVAKADTFDRVQVTIDLVGDPDEPGPAPPPIPPPAPPPIPPPAPPTPEPAPTPTPAPTPEPLSRTAQRVRDLANRDIPADLPLRQGLLLGLAGIHAAMADDVAKAVAGIPAYTQLNDPANIIAETASRNRAMAGTSRAAFVPFFTDLKVQVLNPLKPTALATPGGHIQVWRDIAAGLKAAAGPPQASGQAATIPR